MTEYVQTATNGRKYIVNCCERCGKITEGIHTCTPNLVIERLTAELAEKDNHVMLLQHEKGLGILASTEMCKKITALQDLAEHWAILAEQRRVELGECRKDAGRYRHIRKAQGWYGFEVIKRNRMMRDTWLTGKKLDAAIDAAMEAKP